MPGTRLASNRFTAAGRPDHEDVVAAGDRDFQGTLHVLLAFHVGEVVLDGVELLKERRGIKPHRRDLALAGQELDRFAQVGDRKDIEPLDHRRLGYIGRGQDEAGFLLLAGRKRDGKGALDRPQPRP